jgi:hypothetical protein
MLLRTKQVNDECCNDCCCAWVARRAERFGLALNFLAPPFSFKRKRWKTNTKWMLVETRTTPTATLRQAQGDKAQEASAIASSIEQNTKRQYGVLKKLISLFRIVA